MDAQRWDEEARPKVNEIAVELANLTKQLNEFKLVSEAVVGKANKQVSDEVNTRLNLQSERIDLVDESVQKAQKTASDNAEILQNLLIGLENMGENVKHLGEKIENWRNSELQDAAEREYQEMNAALLQEVSFSFPAISEPVQNFSAPMSMFTPASSMPSPILQERSPVLTTPTSFSIPISQYGELQEMRGRISALRKPYPRPQFFIPRAF